VDGKTQTQPLTLKLDPRIRTPAAGLAQLATLTREMYDGARVSHQAYEQAHTLVARLDTVHTAAAAALKTELDAIAPAAAPEQSRRGRGRAGAAAPPPPVTLDRVSDELLAAAMAMQGADVTPTASQVAACARARTRYHEAMRRWSAIEAKAR
jgi:hypothetical protein